MKIQFTHTFSYQAKLFAEIQNNPDLLLPDHWLAIEAQDL
jgi:hypothetical protein